jgi:hypothetical protein
MALTANKLNQVSATLCTRHCSSHNPGAPAASPTPPDDALLATDEERLYTDGSGGRPAPLLGLRCTPAAAVPAAVVPAAAAADLLLSTSGLLLPLAAAKIPCRGVLLPGLVPLLPPEAVAAAAAVSPAAAAVRMLGVPGDELTNAFAARGGRRIGCGILMGPDWLGPDWLGPGSAPAASAAGDSAAGCCLAGLLLLLPLGCCCGRACIVR